MESHGSLVVEQLTPVRQRASFEELAGVASGKPVSVGVVNAGVFKDDASANAFAALVRKTLTLKHAGMARTLAIEANGHLRWAVLWERFEGPTVAQVVAEKGPLTPEEAVSVAISLAQTVSYAHANSVIHGDINPEWVTLLTGTTSVEARLGGFGLGQLATPANGRKRTVADDIAGLGEVLHLMLTGAPAQGRIGALPDTALHLGSVLSRSLGLDLSDRYRTVDEFSAALGEANRTRVSRGHVVAASEKRTSIALRTLGPWELQELLGEGAMGQVFLAKHSLLGRQAAIKVLRPEQYQREDLIQRFFQEARSVNQINHEHIVEISDFGQELGPDGKPTAVYFVMELLQGETLTQRIAKGPFTIERTVHVISQLASALAAAHRLGVVHRDVKTDNVFLINRQRDTEYVKVLDFGVAKLTQLTPDAPTVSTMDGAIIGTPTSMSPEQASGGTVDARADVYAVGVLLYLLLSGKLPIDADNFGKLIALLLTKPPEPLPEVTPKGERIPPALAAVVMKCLEKDPAKRPQSMDALVHSLTNASETTELVLPQRRSRTGLFVGVGAVVVAGIVGAVVLLQPKPVVVKDPVVVVTPPSVPDAAVEVMDAGAVAVAEPIDAGVEEEPEDAGAQVAAVGVPDAGVAVVKVQKPKPFSTALLEQPFALASPRFNKCVQSNKALLPAGQSSIALRFVFEKSGVSTDSTVLDAAIAGELRACLVRVMKSIRIAPHTGPVKATVYRMPLTP